jgi:hypothetical protein
MRLENGKSYFGRILIKSGSSGNVTQIGKVLRNAGWLVPASGEKLPSGAIGTWFYGVGPMWGKDVWPSCVAGGEHCTYSGYDVCKIPWINRRPGCPGDENRGAPNLQSPAFAPIDGTVTLWARVNEQNEPYTVFPPPSDDPWWQHKQFGASRSGYDRTAWISSVWTGPTGDHDVRYHDETLGFVEAFELWDLWDENGASILRNGKQKGSIGFERASSGPDIDRATNRPDMQPSTPTDDDGGSSSLLWIGGAIVTAIGIWWAMSGGKR